MLSSGILTPIDDSVHCGHTVDTSSPDHMVLCPPPPPPHIIQDQSYPFPYIAHPLSYWPSSQRLHLNFVRVLFALTTCPDHQISLSSTPAVQCIILPNMLCNSPLDLQIGRMRGAIHKCATVFRSNRFQMPGCVSLDHCWGSIISKHSKRQT